MTPNKAAMKAAEAHALADYPRESVGIIVVQKRTQRYIPCKNTATTPDQHFKLEGREYAAAADMGRIVAVVHSHPNGTALASQRDLVGCEEASGDPWLIIAVGGDPVQVGGHSLIRPSGYVLPLVEREFDYELSNCFHLIRDWYARELNITLPDFDIGPEQWWNPKHENYRADFDPYTDGIDTAGFVDAGSPMQPGDIILMQIRAKVPNHAAVYIGDGLILHHLYDRLSCRDVYGGYWKDVTRRIVRRG